MLTAVRRRASLSSKDWKTNHHGHLVDIRMLCENRSLKSIGSNPELKDRYRKAGDTECQAPIVGHSRFCSKGDICILLLPRRLLFGSHSLIWAFLPFILATPALISTLKLLVKSSVIGSLEHHAPFKASVAVSCDYSLDVGLLSKSSVVPDHQVNLKRKWRLLPSVN